MCYSADLKNRVTKVRKRDKKEAFKLEGKTLRLDNNPKIKLNQFLKFEDQQKSNNFASQIIKIDYIFF